MLDSIQFCEDFEWISDHNIEEVKVKDFAETQIISYDTVG